MYSPSSSRPIAGERQVDVHVDSSFNVISSYADADKPGEPEGASDN